MMLFGEFVNGDYLVELVVIMNWIDIKVENNLDKFGWEVFDFDKFDVIEMIGFVVVMVVCDLGVKVIVVVIVFGYMVWMIFKYCFFVDILVFIFDECMECGLMINWGV